MVEVTESYEVVVVGAGNIYFRHYLVPFSS